jgi:cation transport regulator ChaC
MKKVIECLLEREWITDGSMSTTAMYNTNDTHDHEEEFIRRNIQNQQFNGQEQHHETIMQLAQLHQESRKIRPMTCGPNTICMQSTYFTS